MNFRNPIKVFRPNMMNYGKSIFKLFLPLCIVIPILTFVNGIIDNGGITLDDLGLAFGLLIVICLVALTLILLIQFISLFFPVKVYKEGIRCYNFYGFYKNVRWNDIRYVTSLHTNGLKYAEIKVNGLKTKITIPLFLGNMKEFKELVKKYDTSGQLSFYLESIFD